VGRGLNPLGAARPEIVANDGTAPTVRIRASSWGELFDCAYRWEGKHMLGMRSPSGLPAHLGTSIHHGTAVFDDARVPGCGLPKVDVFDAVQAFCDVFDNPPADVVMDGPMTMREARAVGARLVSEYCQTISPRYTFVAVEQKFQPMRVACDGVVIELTGSMDRGRAAKGADGIVLADLKSGARVLAGDGTVSIHGRSAQLGVYSVMWEQQQRTPVVASQIIALPTTGKHSPAVSRLWDAKTVFLGTDTAPGLITIAAAMVGSGLFPPNPSSGMCSEKFCPRWSKCIYHE